MQQPPRRPRPTGSTGSSRPAGTRRPSSAPRPSGTGRPASGQRPPASRKPQGASRPVGQRPAGAQRSARPAGSQPRRRPMTPRQYEAMRRQRQMQNMKMLAILAAFAVLLVVGVVMILRPAPARDVSAQPPAVQATQAPGVVANPVPASLADPRDDDAAPAATAIPTLAVDTPVPTVTAVPTPRPGGLRSAHMRVIGDVMVCENQLKVFKATGYDFHPQFEYIKDVLSNADYTMANMEGTVGQYKKVNYSGFPQFNAPETILQAVKDSGVDFLTLANNHMLDRWFDGMKNTVTLAEQFGFDHVGAYRTQQERNTPVIYEVNGIRIGFVAYTYGTNGIENKGVDPDAVKYGVPYLDKADIEGDIKRLKEAGAEVVIAFPHWGEEYIREPDESQLKYAKKLANAGADIILGSHSHEVQRMEYVDFTDTSGRARRVFIIYSLGNFLSDHVKQYCDNGIVVDFTINENADGSFTCDNVGYIPTYCWQPERGDGKVLPIGRYLNNPPSGMSEADYNRMVESYAEVTGIIGSNFPVLEG